jgi:hypothetical protein
MFLALGALALWWAAAIAARDLAVEAARTLCRSYEWQLLDETVSLVRIRPTRGPRGLELERRYRFEFSADGGERSAGGLRMNGRRITMRWAETPDGRLIEQALGRNRS